jgi:hypothetical protein
MKPCDGTELPEEGFSEPQFGTAPSFDYFRYVGQIAPYWPAQVFIALAWEGAETQGAPVRTEWANGATNQQFKLVYNGGARFNHNYRILTADGQYALEVPLTWPTGVNGAPVTLNRYHGTANQKWGIRGSQGTNWPDNPVQWYNEWTGQCLDVAGYDLQAEAQLQTYDCNGGANQQFGTPHP